MKQLYNSAGNIGNIIEPKEGEHALLYSNTADICSPSLGMGTGVDCTDEKLQLDYLAEILYEFLSEKRNGKRIKESGDLLQGIDERASRGRQ